MELDTARYMREEARYEASELAREHAINAEVERITSSPEEFDLASGEFSDDDLKAIYSMLWALYTAKPVNPVRAGDLGALALIRATLTPIIRRAAVTRVGDGRNG